MIYVVFGVLVLGGCTVVCMRTGDVEVRVEDVRFD